MGRKAKLKKLRKTLKDEPFMQELVENVGFMHEKLISLNVSSTGENAQALFEFVASIERPENITDDEFEVFLDKKMTNFIENNLK